MVDNILKGKVLIQFGVINKNDRIYLESEFTKDRIWHTDGSGNTTEGSLIERLNGIKYFRMKGKEKVEKQKDRPFLYGEITHPDVFEVNLGDVSHLCKNFKITNNCLIADVEIVDTKKGKMLLEMIRVFGEDAIVFRPRGTGILNEQKEVTQYDVFAFDAINSKDDAFELIKVKI